MSRGAALADASRSRFADGAGFRVDRRTSGAVPVWQTDRELSGTGAVRRIERRSATVGTHHEARQFTVAFPAGVAGSIPARSTKSPNNLDGARPCSHDVGFMVCVSCFAS